MNIVAFIFARGGSKGLPNKNIKVFNGKPLIAWSIHHAKSISRISRVIVSTDSEEIAEIATKYGADVPFIRPHFLATDESPEWLSWQHGLKYLQMIDGSLPDLMLSIPPTSPLRDINDIDRVINEYIDNEADAVITVTESFRNPYFNIIKDTLNGYVEICIKNNKAINRRQDSPKTYDITTVAYALNPSFVINNSNIFDGKVRKTIVSRETAIDIDSLLDFEYAEYLFKKNIINVDK